MKILTEMSHIFGITFKRYEHTYSNMDTYIWVPTYSHMYTQENYTVQLHIIINRLYLRHLKI